MIGKIFKYSSFDAVLKYVLEDVGAKLISSNMISKNWKLLSREFQLFTANGQSMQSICYHVILSIASREAGHPMGECNQHLSDYDYYRIARRYLEEMGFLNGSGIGMHKSQYVAARHRGKDREEIHIIVSRVRMNGTIVSNCLEHRRNDVVVKQMKLEFGLDDSDETDLALFAAS